MTAAEDVPRWLDEHEQRAWRLYLKVTKTVADTLERELSRETGISHAYYEVLVRLSEAPGRTLRMSELADTSLSSRSRLSHAVARMEEQGWIERRSCPDDGRGLNAHLTGAGFDALAAAAPVHVRGVRAHLFDALDAEQVRALHDLLAALDAHLQREDQPPRVSS